MRVGGQRHTPAALLLGKRPGTHCIGGCVGPRAGLNENLAPTGFRFPDCPARGESLYRLRHPSLIPMDKTSAKCYKGRRWQDNVQMSPQGAGCESVKWGKVERVRIQWWAVGNTVLKLRGPQMAWDFLIECFRSVIDCWGRIIHMELVLYLISHKTLYLLS